MALLHDVSASIDGREATAPPSWVNAELAVLNGTTILHSGGGALEGGWHSQDSDEVLLVITGSCTVHIHGSPVVVGPGQLVHIDAGEPHRIETSAGTTLLAIESIKAIRTNLTDPNG